MSEMLAGEGGPGPDELADSTGSVSVHASDRPANVVPEPTRTWMANRRLARLDGAVAALAAGAAVLGAIWFTYHFAVNVIFADQWRDVFILNKAYLGQLTAGDIWAQYIEHRVVFPNLLLLTVGRWTNDNLVVTDMICAVLACTSACTLLWSFRRWTPRLPWVALIPPLFVMLSPVPMGQALFGFNVCWYMALAAFGLAVLAADGPNARTGHLLLAGAAATVGSFSSLPGLFIWPAVGLLLIVRRRRPAQQVGWWVLAAIVMTAFFIGYQPAGGGHATTDYLLHHPGAVAGYFLSELGVVTGIGEGHATAAQYTSPLAVAGVVVLVLAAVGMVAAWRSDRSDGSPVGIAMVVMALLFAATSTIGRVGQGIDHAFLFALFMVNLWSATYLLWIAMALRSSRSPEGRSSIWNQLTTAGAFAVAVLVAVVWVLSAVDGIAYARNYRRLELRWVAVEANADHVPAAVLDKEVANGNAPVFIAWIVQVAERRHLSLFAGGRGADVPGAQGTRSPRVAVVLPQAGVVRSQSVLLNAAVNGQERNVQFIISGPHGSSIHIPGKVWQYGWIAGWHPNGPGHYTIEAIATTNSGRSATSAPVSIEVVADPPGGT
jgi:hypothetical protein